MGNRESLELQSDNKPIQVTTRSGSLMQPGPEPPADFEEAPTPTFVPEEAPMRPARRFSSEIPQGNRGPIRESATRMGHESSENKPTMFTWMQGLWGGKKTSETSSAGPHSQSAPKTQPSENSNPDSQLPGSSIDPRRVYRDPKPPEEIDETGPGSRFSETGVPKTNTDFRGRADSAF